LITLYKGNLLPSDCRLLAALKENLYGYKFKDDHKVEKEVIRWLMAGDTEWYQLGTEQLVKRYDKCLSCGGGLRRNVVE
jgi:hypothetical protein